MIKIYTKTNCPYCVNAKQLLEAKGVEYSEIKLDNANESEFNLMVRLSGGRKTVPQIFIGDRHIGGFDDLTKLNTSGQLDQLLFKL